MTNTNNNNDQNPKFQVGELGFYATEFNPKPTFFLVLQHTEQERGWHFLRIYWLGLQVINAFDVKRGIQEYKKIENLQEWLDNHPYRF